MVLLLYFHTFNSFLELVNISYIIHDYCILWAIIFEIPSIFLTVQMQRAISVKASEFLETELR